MEIPNLNFIKNLANGDQAFEIKFMQILKEEFPIEKSEYLKSINANRMSEAAQIVHKLKHKLSVLSLYEDYELAIRHEKALNEEDTSYQYEFLNILNKVEDFIKSLRL